MITVSQHFKKDIWKKVNEGERKMKINTIKVKEVLTSTRERVNEAYIINLNRDVDIYLSNALAKLDTLLYLIDWEEEKNNE